MEVALEQQLVDPSMDHEALNLACGSFVCGSFVRTLYPADMQHLARTVLVGPGCTWPRGLERCYAGMGFDGVQSSSASCKPNPCSSWADAEHEVWPR